MKKPFDLSDSRNWGEPEQMLRPLAEATEIVWERKTGFALYGDPEAQQAIGILLYRYVRTSVEVLRSVEVPDDPMVQLGDLSRKWQQLQLAIQKLLQGADVQTVQTQQHAWARLLDRHRQAEIDARLSTVGLDQARADLWLHEQMRPSHLPDEQQALDLFNCAWKHEQMRRCIGNGRGSPPVSIAGFIDRAAALMPFDQPELDVIN